MKLWKLNLHLFDGEGGGGAAGAAGAAGAGAAETGAAVTAPADAGQTAANTQGDPAQTVDKNAAFEALIKGEYKGEFDGRVQKIINERFKTQKALEKQLSELQPLVDAVSTKYGIDANDRPGLMKAMEADESYYQEAADAMGLTVDQYKQFQRIERENAAFRAAEEQRARAEHEQQTLAKWDGEAKQLQQMYPAFDLQTECRDPETGGRFLKLLGSGVDMRTAYEVIHRDQLISGAIGAAVQQTQQRTMDSIRAQGMRPQENGSGGSAATQMVKVDPSKLTKAERAAYAERAKRGERVTFT